MKYRWSGRDPAGQPAGGQLVAADEPEALRALGGAGILVTGLEPAVVAAKRRAPAARGRVGAADVLQFYSQFYFLFRAGVPLFQSLEAVARETDHPTLASVLERVCDDLTEGKSLSEALAAHPRAFSSMQVSLVRVGESTGKLQEALGELVAGLEDELELARRVQKALAYPLFTLAVAVLVLAAMFFFVFPPFARLFKQRNLKMPALTRTFVSASEALTANPATAAGVAALVVVGGGALAGSRAARDLLDRHRTRIPVWGPVARDTLVYRFARDMGLLLETAVPLVDALAICRDGSPSATFRAELDRAIARVREGQRLADVLAGSPLFPPLVLHLVAIGEGSGQLAAMMKAVHEHYAKRVDRSLAKFTAAIGPALTLLLGGLVLLMAISLYLPMFELARSLRRSA